MTLGKGNKKQQQKAATARLLLNYTQDKNFQMKKSHFIMTKEFLKKSQESQVSVLQNTKGKIDRITIIVGKFNTPLSVTNRKKNQS